MNTNEIIKEFDIAESNVIKLEAIWQKVSSNIPSGFNFTDSSNEYDTACIDFLRVYRALPTIDGWKPEIEFSTLNDIAQTRIDFLDIGEPSQSMDFETKLNEPGNIIAKYKVLLSSKRREFIRELVLKEITEVDEQLKKLEISYPDTYEPINHKIDDGFNEIRNAVKKIDILLGSERRAKEWGDLNRHLRFSMVADLFDIRSRDWVAVKEWLTEIIYSSTDPRPASVADLDELLVKRPKGKIITDLKWNALTAESFEKLIFNLVCDSEGYENTQLLTHVNAADKGRDISTDRITEDPLLGLSKKRVIIQCKHWLSKSVAAEDVSSLLANIKLWEPPKVDIVIIATSGDFSTNAVDFAERHNMGTNTPEVAMWNKSRLESMLAKRPDLCINFSLK